MIRIDEQVTPVPPFTAYQIAADVERWPDILRHYRWVRFQSRRSFGRGIVEMAAYRDFGDVYRWPTWWVSEMDVDADAPVVRYRHVDGITRGMVVRWEFLTVGERRTRVRVIHEWDGPRWPVIARPAASLVIGPHFVSAIARRTLAGVCAAAEAAAREHRYPASVWRHRPAAIRDATPTSRGATSRDADSSIVPERRQRQPHV